MSEQTVKCAKCGRELVVDKSWTAAVGGGATPIAPLEREIICPDCRVVTRFSDERDRDAGGSGVRERSS